MIRRRCSIAALLVVVAMPAFAGTSGLLRCQKILDVRAAVFSKLTQTALSNCATRVVACQLAQELDAEDPTQCLAAATASCATYSAKISSGRSAAQGKAIAACNVVPLADLQPWIGGLGLAGPNAACGASTVIDLIDCLFDGAQCAAERIVWAFDPRAGDALATAGIAASHPCVGP